MSASDRARLTPKRYRVTLANVADQRFTYYVCSCLDDRKALVIAAGYHDTSRPDPRDRIYEVVEVTPVDGDRLQDTDLCDRAEW